MDSGTTATTSNNKANPEAIASAANMATAVTETGSRAGSITSYFAAPSLSTPTLPDIITVEGTVCPHSMALTETKSPTAGEADTRFATTNNFEDKPSTSITSEPLRPPSILDLPFNTTGDELRDRLEGLPQELYDEIRRLTFIFDFTSEKRCISQNYKPPFQLQLNKQIRTDFFKLYYGAPVDWVFVPEHLTKSGTHPPSIYPSQIGYHMSTIKMWLDSISSEAMAALPGVAYAPNFDISRSSCGFPFPSQRLEVFVLWRDIGWRPPLDDRSALPGPDDVVCFVCRVLDYQR